MATNIAPNFATPTEGISVVFAAAPVELLVAGVRVAEIFARMISVGVGVVESSPVFGRIAKVGDGAKATIVGVGLNVGSTVGEGLIFSAISAGDVAVEVGLNSASLVESGVG